MDRPFQNLGQLFLRTTSYGKPDHLLVQEGDEWRPVSSEELYRRVGRLHLALKQMGLRKGDRCALLSENRWEWATADFAMMTAGIVSVPVYATLPPEQVHYLLENSGARAVFVSTPAQLEKVYSVWERLPELERVISFERPEGQPQERVRRLDEILGREPLTAAEKEQLESAIQGVGAEDLASILYTSGTTGTPKGVMLTHGNLVSNVFDTDPDLRADDLGLSFLPLCHIYQRIVDYCYYLFGLTVAHVPLLEKVPEALLQVQPTVVVAVPRFFEKMHGRVMDTVSQAPAIRQKLFHWGLGIGYRSIPYRLSGERMPVLLNLQLQIADRLVFSKVRARLGGRVRQFLSGSAPLSRDLAEFFYAAGLPVYEGYGLTETSPVVSFNRPGAIKFGTVGRPIRNVEVRLAADGEILVRGPNVMRGYYKMERETAEVMDGDWLKTGDIGMLDADGFLVILDRKKDLLKTSGGKFIAPQPLENRLKGSPYISDAVVIADQRRFPAALIVPDFARLESYAREQGIAFSDRTELVARPEIVRLLEQEVNRLSAGLAPFEQVKRIAILEREFSIAGGEITPTMKVRRREVERRYREEIERLYEESVASG
jgi:long-chain acyl-CoA synthetase